FFFQTYCHAMIPLGQVTDRWVGLPTGVTTAPAERVGRQSKRRLRRYEYAVATPRQTATRKRALVYCTRDRVRPIRYVPLRAYRSLTCCFARHLLDSPMERTTQDDIVADLLDLSVRSG